MGVNQWEDDPYGFNTDSSSAQDRHPKQSNIQEISFNFVVDIEVQ